MDDDAAATPLRSASSGELTPRDSTAAKQVRIVSARVSLGDRLREIWDSRELLVYMVRTEIKVKYKNSALGLVWSMISPAMARRFLLPCWKQWCDQARAAGVPVMDMDSDGFIGELIPLWIEAGFNVCDPIEVAAGNDINQFRRAFGTHTPL